MKIYLDKVVNDGKDILYRLVQYSLFEESLNDGNEMNNDGIFEYKCFDKYFGDDDSEAFLLESAKLINYWDVS